jgi:crossover junction endodeoxyribonuclease RusA
MTEIKAEYEIGITHTLAVPWPMRELSPNARKDWHSKAKMIAIQRQAGLFEAIMAKMRIPKDELLQMTVNFYPPSYRRYDIDNLLAAMKPTIDGIFEATDANDHQIKRITLNMGEKYKDGQVIITIEVLDAK